MVHSTYRTMGASRRAYRSATNKMLAGVCGGLAEHFNISSTWLRVGFLVGCIFQPPVVLVAYVIAAFAMPKPEGYTFGRCSSRRRREQSTSFGETRQAPPRRKTVSEVRSELDDVEAKIRAMEDRVTSREYILKRKFEEL